MKKKVQVLIILFTLLIFTLRAYSQLMTPEEIENALTSAYQEISGSGYPSTSDSIEAYDSIFRQKMLYYMGHYSETLNDGFDSLLQSNDIHIVTSKDGLFRIYSWDRYDGGTMHSFDNLFQYKSGGTVYAKLTADTGTDQNYDPGVSYNTIYTLRGNGKKYYMAFGQAAYSSMIGGVSVKIFSIEHSKLNDTVKLFQREKGRRMNTIEFSYSIGFNYPGDSLPAFIQYDTLKKLLFLPISTPDDSVTGKYNLYRFNGSLFQFVEHK